MKDGYLPFWWKYVPLWLDRLLGLTRSVVGCEAICSKGRLGVIRDRKRLPWGLAWTGATSSVALWSSRNPRLTGKCSQQ